MLVSVRMPVLLLTMLMACASSHPHDDENVGGGGCLPRDFPVIDRARMEESIRNRFPEPGVRGLIRTAVRRGNDAADTFSRLGDMMDAGTKCVPHGDRPDDYLRCVGVPGEDPLIGSTKLVMGRGARREMVMHALSDIQLGQGLVLKFQLSRQLPACDGQGGWEQSFSIR